MLPQQLWREMAYIHGNSRLQGVRDSSNKKSPSPRSLHTPNYHDDGAPDGNQTLVDHPSWLYLSKILTYTQPGIAQVKFNFF